MGRLTENNLEQYKTTPKAPHFEQIITLQDHGPIRDYSEERQIREFLNRRKDARKFWEIINDYNKMEQPK